MIILLILSELHSFNVGFLGDKKKFRVKIDTQTEQLKEHISKLNTITLHGFQLQLKKYRHNTKNQ